MLIIDQTIVGKIRPHTVECEYPFNVIGLDVSLMWLKHIKRMCKLHPNSIIWAGQHASWDDFDGDTLGFYKMKTGKETLPLIR